MWHPRLLLEGSLPHVMSKTPSQRLRALAGTLDCGSPDKQTIFGSSLAEARGMKVGSERGRKRSQHRMERGNIEIQIEREREREK